MKVFIVQEFDPEIKAHEIMGVFSTEKKAREYMKELARDWGDVMEYYLEIEEVK